MKPSFTYIWEIVKVVIIALVIVLPIRYFIFQPFVVSGDSMVPNFHSGDYLIIDEISYRFSQPQRGDVIIFKYPKNPAHRFIKRIIGLPGETVEIKDDQVKVYNKDGQEQTLQEISYIPASKPTYGDVRVILGEKEYFVLGDNRPYSSDSRIWGPVPAENIVGKVFIRIFPLAALGKITAPAY